MTDTPAKLRIDKWLWQARFFKTRGLSAKTVSGGHCRVNSLHVAKPSASVSCGDVLTFPQGRHIRVIRIDALGTRRGPAPEAQALYTDLDPPKPVEKPLDQPEARKGGRPTKRDRRKLDQSRATALE